MNLKRLDRPTHNLFWQRLLSSGARVADPEQADWFFIPVSVAPNPSICSLQAGGHAFNMLYMDPAQGVPLLGFMLCCCQVRQRGMGDKDLLADAVDYIRSKWPYWDRYDGGRHFAIHTGKHQVKHQLH
jgi:hypothetical protein